MQTSRRSGLIYGLLLGFWALVVAWQVDEHARVIANGKTSLRKDSKAIASTLGAFIRGLQFRGTVFTERLEPVLHELVQGSTNQIQQSGELISIVLLNASGEPVVSAGKPFDPELKDILQEGERWGARSVTMVYPVEGATNTQPTVLAPGGIGRGFRGRGSRPGPPDGTNDTNNANPNDATARTNSTEMRDGPPPNGEGGPDRRPPDFGPGPGNRGDRGGPPREGEPRPRRPFWARGMDDAEYQEVIQKRELHGLVLTMSTDAFQTVVRKDLWLRCVISFFAAISALGVAVAWGNLSKSSELQLRLVRASELNTHLKKMNLAAAGLAHETRNPLNIIRGMAQMITKQPGASGEIEEKALAIVEETDKVTVQLNEFINYSRPREIRRSKLALNSVANEVVRTLGHDVEEKKVTFEVKGEPVAIEADEQMLRQALFNLALNAVQAVAENGLIQIVIQKTGATEASLEIRDDGPGVSPENRQEIFKPYFTTHQKGTGLGLAMVQQIVLMHGWDIQCLANEPKGAVFRITHLKISS
jgi:signal transduction histidine kinase